MMCSNIEKYRDPKFLQEIKNDITMKTGFQQLREVIRFLKKVPVGYPCDAYLSLFHPYIQELAKYHAEIYSLNVSELYNRMWFYHCRCVAFDMCLIIRYATYQTLKYVKSLWPYLFRVLYDVRELLHRRDLTPEIVDLWEKYSVSGRLDLFTGNEPYWLLYKIFSLSDEDRFYVLVTSVDLPQRVWCAILDVYWYNRSYYQDKQNLHQMELYIKSLKDKCGVANYYHITLYTYGLASLPKKFSVNDYSIWRAENHVYQPPHKRMLVYCLMLWRKHIGPALNKHLILYILSLV